MKNANSNDGAEKRLANLKPFKKGQSGNPKGREKGSVNLSTRIKRILEDNAELPPAVVNTIKKAVGSDKKALDAIIMVGLLQSLQGDKAWAQLLLEHGWGKPEQVSKLIGKDGESLNTLVQVYLPDNARKG